MGDVLRETVHAGGSNKNRLFDGLLDFPAGDYIAYFVTDDSHAYRDWNASPPYDQKHWGLTLAGAATDFDSRDVSAYQESEDQSVLARLVRVRDHEKVESRFTLDRDNGIRIYAMGEGERSEMYDYGWIENVRTGKVVWEMNYRLTRHAGGARKNRLYNDVIRLPKGEYQVFFETDDSHAFRDWNASPPYDPENWESLYAWLINYG